MAGEIRIYIRLVSIHAPVKGATNADYAPRYARRF